MGFRSIFFAMSCIGVDGACAPSRSSIMSSWRPNRTRPAMFSTTFRKAPGVKSWVTMPDVFNNVYYFVSAAGNISHGVAWSGDVHDVVYGCSTCLVTIDRAVESRHWHYGAVTWTDLRFGHAMHKL